VSPRPPGPPPQAGVANYRLFCADAQGFLRAVADHFGDVASFVLGRTPYVLVNEPGLVRSVLVDHQPDLRKPEFMKSSNRGFWGDGLTTLEGEEWRVRRRLLRPCFRREHVQRHLTDVAKFTREMLERWPDRGSVDLHHEFRLLTARCAAAFVLDAEIAELAAAPGVGHCDTLPLREMFGEDFTGTAGGDDTAPISVTRPRAPRNMDITVHTVRARMSSGVPRGDVLSELTIRTHPRALLLDAEQMTGELVQMLYAGHHTIPGAMLWFWRDVSSRPSVAARVRAEADAFLAEGTLDEATLAKSWTCAVLKESMRLHPPAPILYREVDRTFELGGFQLEKAVGLWISPELLHRDPRNFPDPERFDPERFLGRPSDDQLYLPFGFGPRTCIGGRLALHQMVMTILIVTHDRGLESLDADRDSNRPVGGSLSADRSCLTRYKKAT
jgi:enediyne biosynthesis protein E7